MTDLEISKALALAIGWKPDQMRLPMAWRDGNKLQVATNYGDYWREFDYMDWRVIGPIAAVYCCFPVLMRYGRWVAGCHSSIGDTAQKAIALAIIKRLKK